MENSQWKDMKICFKALDVSQNLFCLVQGLAIGIRYLE